MVLQNTSPRKKARKSLERKWSTPGDIGLFGGQGDTLGLMPETPVSMTESEAEDILNQKM